MQHQHYMQLRPELHRLFTAYARRLVRNVRESITEEDLVQEAEIAAYQLLERTTDSGENLIAYLTLRGRGAMLDHIRAHRWTPRNQPVESMQSTDTDEYIESPTEGHQCSNPERIYAAVQTVIELERYASKGAHTHRAVVLALLVDGKSQITIAKELGVTESRISQIVKQLREHLESLQ